MSSTSILTSDFNALSPAEQLAQWESFVADLDSGAILASRDAAQDIFLDWSLQPALRAAALAQGTVAAQLERQIQHPVRGRAALVKHAAAHIHHMHVRFRCPAHDPGCLATH